MMNMTLFNRMQDRMKRTSESLLRRALAKRGYALTRAGNGFRDARSTVRQASLAGLSLCEYLESLEDDPRKRGRRDRVIERMQQSGCLTDVSHVTEIGSGTGMYLDRVIQLAKPECYEVFETAVDWRDFLRAHTRQFSAETIVHDADGQTLSHTKDAVSDLVHAHGVFVYLTTIQTFRYLSEMARVCRPGGFIVFDWYLDSTFSTATIWNWIESGWQFPVVTSRTLAEQFCAELNLEFRDRFTEVHGASMVDYEILQKVEG